MRPEADSESMGSGSDVGDKLPRSTKSSRPGGRRTHRACDRCRVKKSKCNGQQPCNTCKANERTCVFSALRRRDIRKWHCHMQDTVDEAIQRLYRACRTSACFPGVLPDDKDGYVTTESILRGMGFTNLDIGPKATSILSPAAIQTLPLRQLSGDKIAQPDLRAFYRADTGSDLDHHSNHSSRSMESATSGPLPHEYPNVYAASMVHDPRGQHSPTITPLTHGQHQPGMVAVVPPEYPGMGHQQQQQQQQQHYYEHHDLHRYRYHQEQMAGNHQHLTQNHNHELCNLHQQSLTGLASMYSLEVPMIPFDTRRSQPTPYFHDGGPLLPSERVWSH